MTDLNSDFPTRTGSFKAAVRAGTTVTEYTRAGVGRPILLLLRKSAGDDSSSAQVLQAIADRFRVIAPEQIPAAGEFATWLTSFLDGLGLARASIVTEDELGVPVFSYALLEPSRVDRLVVLSKAGLDTDPLDGSLAAPVPEGSHPLLIVRQDGPIEDVVAKVVGFLAAT